MSVGSTGLVKGLTNSYVKFVSFLAALMCQRCIYEIGGLAQHHREGAFVVDESLQRVLVKADRTRCMGEKGLKSKGCLHTHTFILWYRDPQIYLRRLICSWRDLCALWQFKKYKETLDHVFPPDTAQGSGGKEVRRTLQVLCGKCCCPELDSGNPHASGTCREVSARKSPTKSRSPQMFCWV